MKIAHNGEQNKNKTIEEITGRRVRMGVLQYKVKWNGVAEEAWVSAKSLEEAHELIVQAEERWKVKEEEQQEEEEKEEEQQEEEQEEEEEEETEQLKDNRKTKKSTMGKELKNLLRP